MKYSDKRNRKEAKAGDFIYADGELRVIHKTCVNGAVSYEAIFVTGSRYFEGSVVVENSIEELVGFYKRMYVDFELIRADEMELVRR